MSYDSTGDVLSTWFTKKGKEKADAAYSDLDKVDTKRMTAQQAYNEGRGTAASAASDKAGIAKRQAKAAAMMNGAGKMQAAVQGAQAANDAAVNGFDSTASNAANLAASQDNASKAAAQQLATTKAQGLAQNAQNEASSLSNAALAYSQGKNAAKTADKDRKWNRAKDLLSLGASFASANKDQ